MRQQYLACLSNLIVTRANVSAGSLSLREDILSPFPQIGADFSATPSEKSENYSAQFGRVTTWSSPRSIGRIGKAAIITFPVNRTVFPTDEPRLPSKVYCTLFRPYIGLLKFFQ